MNIYLYIYTANIYIYYIFLNIHYIQEVWERPIILNWHCFLAESSWALIFAHLETYWNMNGWKKSGQPPGMYKIL